MIDGRVSSVTVNCVGCLNLLTSLAATTPDKGDISRSEARAKTKTKQKDNIEHSVFNDWLNLFNAELSPKKH